MEPRDTEEFRPERRRWADANPTPVTAIAAAVTAGLPRAAGLARADALARPRAAFKTFAAARHAEGRDRHGAYYAKHPQARVSRTAPDFVSDAGIRLQRVPSDPRGGTVVLDYKLPRAAPAVGPPPPGTTLRLHNPATGAPVDARVVRHLSVNEPGRRTGRLAVRLLGPSD